MTGSSRQLLEEAEELALIYQARGLGEEQARAFADAGLRVLAIDLRGRGDTRTGRAGPDSLQLDVLGAIDYLMCEVYDFFATELARAEVLSADVGPPGVISRGADDRRGRSGDSDGILE